MSPTPERDNPLDTVEGLAGENDWSFERAGDEEIIILVEGQSADYQITFTWMSESEVLHLACAFDLKVPSARRTEAQALIALINEQLWVGHFDIWRDESLVMFRHGLVLTGGATASKEQCKALLAAGFNTCERYFSAFQFVVWAGKSAKEALAAAQFDTKGEA